MNPTLSPLFRVSAAGCLAASGVLHALLYLHGYRTIPGVGADPWLWRCYCWSAPRRCCG